MLNTCTGGGKYTKDYRNNENIDYKFKHDLANFIKHAMDDSEFWLAGGIPTKEEYYINKYNMTEEQVYIFYDAMCSLQTLNREINQ